MFVVRINTVQALLTPLHPPPTLALLYILMLRTQTIFPLTMQPHAKAFKRSGVQSQAVELRTLQFLFISSPVIKFPHRGLSSIAILSYQITTRPDRKSLEWKALGMYYLQTTMTICKS